MLQISNLPYTFSILTTQILNQNKLNLIPMHPTTTMLPHQNPTDSNTKTHLPEAENLSRSNTTICISHDETAPTVRRSRSLELKRKEVKEEEATVPPKTHGTAGRDKLKKHRVDVAGRVWVPDMWGQENYLKDWTDCAAADVSLVNSSIVLARDSLMREGRTATSLRLLGIQNGC